MCLLIVKEKGIQKPSWEHLNNGWNANSDGVGIAWTDGKGFVSFKKFLEYNDFKKFCKTAEFAGKEEDYSIMYHFRWATHGSVKLQNVHPFVLSSSPRDILKTEGKARSVVGHNGIITSVGADPHLDFSDTMVFVRDILASKPIADNMEVESVQDLLENFIGQSKIAILYGTGKFVFVKKHMGITEKTGVWYSNSGYKSFASYRPLSLPTTNYNNAYYESLYEKEEAKALKDIEACTFGNSNKNTKHKALASGKMCDYCYVSTNDLRSDGYGSMVCKDCWDSYFANT